MACVVIEDIINLSLCISKENLYGVRDAVDSLFSLYIVCHINREKVSNIYMIE